MAIPTAVPVLGAVVASKHTYSACHPSIEVASLCFELLESPHASEFLPSSGAQRRHSQRHDLRRMQISMPRTHLIARNARVHGIDSIDTMRSLRSVDSLPGA
jgi:oligoendopeptidase F